MKHIVRTLAITALFSGASLQSSMEPNLKTIRAVKDLTFHPLTPVTVTLEQGASAPKSITFKRNTDRLPKQKQLSYDENGRNDISIMAQMSIHGEDKTNWATNSGALMPTDLADKEIHIVKNDLQPAGFNVILKPVHQKAPKKQKIRAYKPNEADQQEEWWIRITDSTGDGIISESKFKQNTDYKVKKLFVQLNNSFESNDKHPNYKYNWNRVVWMNAPGGTPQKIGNIEVPYFKPGNELEITQTGVRLIHKDDQKSSPQ